MNYRRQLFTVIAVFAILTSCARPPVTKPESSLEPVGWWRVGLNADDLAFAGLADAAKKSLDYYLRLSSSLTPTVIVGPENINARDMADTLSAFLAIIENPALSADQKVSRIKENFDLYRSVGTNVWGKVLFTGYYEPIISCRHSASEVYKYPLYKRPDDVIEVDLTQFGEFGKDRILGRLSGKKVVPYYSRQEIDQQKSLDGKGLEVLWCADPVDIYLLQVQGSGRADLGNGEVVGVLYDGQNGRPYRSIGQYLIDSGAIPKENMSMPAIRTYLRTHSEQLYQILNQNPSYVFFRVENKPAVGNIGLPLTPGRSIATDSRLFPKGALALIRTEKPIIGEDGTVREWVPFTRFVMNQDTGGAIRGAGRVDLFWGQGREAELAAGYMQQEGRLYFLLRKRSGP